MASCAAAAVRRPVSLVLLLLVLALVSCSTAHVCSDVVSLSPACVPRNFNAWTAYSIPEAFSCPSLALPAFTRAVWVEFNGTGEELDLLATWEVDRAAVLDSSSSVNSVESHYVVAVVEACGDGPFSTCVVAQDNLLSLPHALYNFAETRDGDVARQHNHSVDALILHVKTVAQQRYYALLANTTAWTDGDPAANVSLMLLDNTCAAHYWSTRNASGCWFDPANWAQPAGAPPTDVSRGDHVRLLNLSAFATVAGAAPQFTLMNVHGLFLGADLTAGELPLAADMRMVATSDNCVHWNGTDTEMQSPEFCEMAVMHHVQIGAGSAGASSWVAHSLTLNLSLPVVGWHTIHVLRPVVLDPGARGFTRRAVLAAAVTVDTPARLHVAGLLDLDVNSVLDVKLHAGVPSILAELFDFGAAPADLSGPAAVLAGTLVVWLNDFPITFGAHYTLLDASQTTRGISGSFSNVTFVRGSPGLPNRTLTLQSLPDGSIAFSEQLAGPCWEAERLELNKAVKVWISLDDALPEMPVIGPNSSCAGQLLGTGSNGKWFSYKHDEPDELLVATTSFAASEKFDSVVLVTSGSCEDVAGMTCVAADDDGGRIARTSEAEFLAVQGKEYYVLLRGFYPNSVGEVQLELVREDNRTYASGIACSSGIAISVGGVYQGDTTDMEVHRDSLPCFTALGVPGTYGSWFMFNTTAYWASFNGSGIPVDNLVVTTDSPLTVFDTQLHVYRSTFPPLEQPDLFNTYQELLCEERSCYGFSEDSTIGWRNDRLVSSVIIDVMSDMAPTTTKSSGVRALVQPHTVYFVLLTGFLSARGQFALRLMTKRDFDMMVGTGEGTEDDLPEFLGWFIGIFPITVALFILTIGLLLGIVFSVALTRFFAVRYRVAAGQRAHALARAIELRSGAEDDPEKLVGPFVLLKDETEGGAPSGLVADADVNVDIEDSAAEEGGKEEEEDGAFDSVDLAESTPGAAVVPVHTPYELGSPAVTPRGGQEGSGGVFAVTTLAQPRAGLVHEAPAVRVASAGAEGEVDATSEDEEDEDGLSSTLTSSDEPV